MFTHVVVHYHEIALKGRNRERFELQLVRNIREHLRNFGIKIKKQRGIILIESGEQIRDKKEKNIRDALLKIPGIAYFAFSVKTEQNLEKIEQFALALIKERKPKTFKIETKRADKKFPLTSMEVSQRVGAYILKSQNRHKESPNRHKTVHKIDAKLRVDVHSPEITCYVEIIPGAVFVYLNKEKGMGGLPVGASGRVISLLSGGIDSPVASWMAMKRGAQVVFVHFHSVPYTERAGVEKVIELVEIINQYQPRFRTVQSAWKPSFRLETRFPGGRFPSGFDNLYLIPFIEIQKEIVKLVSAKYRVIFYRRFMFRIAEEIAKKERAGAIVTGESLGQVASQTLENMKAIQDVTGLPVLRPLVGMDKEEIIDLAKKIGTYELSILPHSDCCSIFLPKSPATKAKLEAIKKEEAYLDVQGLVEGAIEASRGREQE